MSINVFTYGSLMFREIWERVVIGRYQRVGAWAYGFSRRTVAGRAYPGMIPDAAQAVVGVLHLAIEPGDLVRLDHFEGEEYERSAISVTCDSGRIERAQTYVYLCPEKLTETAWIPGGFDPGRFLRTYCPDPFGS